MKHVSGTPEKLKTKFWTKLAESPLLFLQLDADSGSAVPMRAHLDRNADHAIWFFIASDHHLNANGPATATFVSKDHAIFARFEGDLTEETDRARRQRHWGNDVESWLPGGRDSPSVTMLRMDLGMAEIWDHELGVLSTVKAVLGMDLRQKAAQQHTATAL